MEKPIICFDLDWLYFTEQSFQRFKEIIAPDVEKSQRDLVLYHSDEMKLFKTGKISEEAFWNYARKELWITLPNEEIFAKLRESYEVNEKVEKLVKDLKSRWYKTGICSNNFPTRIRELDIQFHFLKNFDLPVFSYEAGIMKPDPKIFQMLIEKSGVQPENIIYSDDKEEKLAWAKSLWITTFVFHTFEEFVQDLQNCWVEI